MKFVLEKYQNDQTPCSFKPPSSSLCPCGRGLLVIEICGEYCRKKCVIEEGSGE